MGQCSAPSVSGSGVVERPLLTRLLIQVEETEETEKHTVEEKVKSITKFVENHFHTV